MKNFDLSNYGISARLESKKCREQNERSALLLEMLLANCRPNCLKTVHDASVDTSNWNSCYWHCCCMWMRLLVEMLNEPLRNSSEVKTIRFFFIMMKTDRKVVDLSAWVNWKFRFLLSLRKYSDLLRLLFQSCLNCF